MSCPNILGKVKDYINKTRFVILGTISDDGKPALRTLGSFANDDLNIYFSTGKRSAKVNHINSNPIVNFLFQHEGQELSTFKNVTYVGKAKQISCQTELDKAIRILSERSPRFKERAENGELGETAIFKVEPESIKYLDYSNGIGPDAVKEIKF